MKFRSREKGVAMDLLGKSWLWIDLSRKDLESIVKASDECKYKPGDTIMRKGERDCLGFYLVLEGLVEISSNGTTLSRLGEGQFFGEMSLLDDQPRSANVVAIEPSRCLVLSCSSFKELISCNPRIALKICQELARRLRVADEMLNPPVGSFRP
jgi:CRP/FNR family cyclic AMP-dependent transcriptional regulator